MTFKQREVANRELVKATIRNWLHSNTVYAGQLKNIVVEVLHETSEEYEIDAAKARDPKNRAVREDIARFTKEFAEKMTTSGELIGLLYWHKAENEGPLDTLRRIIRKSQELETIKAEASS